MGSYLKLTRPFVRAFEKEIREASFKGGIKVNEPLKDHTTFRIGGAAKLWIEPRDEKDLELLVKYINRYNINSFLIGGGSNILASDRGFDGIAICLSAPYFGRIIVRENRINSGAGVNLARIVNLSSEKSLSGFEALAGIPGTVGGALCMNSGAKKHIGDIVINVKAMNALGRVSVLRAEDLEFGYRSSNLKGFIVLEAEFTLTKNKKESIKARIKDLILARRQSQPWRAKSAGCVFKNPDDSNLTAACLIERCGLKGRRAGGAQISAKHANFIINTGGARAGDVIDLMKLASGKVKKKFDIELKPEIITI